MITYHLWRSIDYGCLDSADTYDILITIFLSLITIPMDFIILPVEMIWIGVDMINNYIIERGKRVGK